MKNPVALLLFSFFLIACDTKINIIKTDKCQLRRTLKEDVFQFNFDLIIQFSKTENLLDESELDVEVNGVYLGKAVIAAETAPIETDRYILPVRVTFPSSKLVVLDENQIKVDGFLDLNGKKRLIDFQEEGIRINNMTAL